MGPHTLAPFADTIRNRQCRATTERVTLNSQLLPDVVRDCDLTIETSHQFGQCAGRAHLRRDHLGEQIISVVIPSTLQLVAVCAE